MSAIRVSGGKAGGLTLKSSRRGGLRPTSSLVRGAIFSILASMNVTPSRVLDLYAGAGTLGIEALSRGAQWADFVEQSLQNYNLIRQNLEGTELEGQSHVYCSSVKKALSFLKGSYDLVLMDPPYGDESIDEVFDKLTGSTLTNADTTIVVEHSRHQSLEERYGRFSLVKSRRYGETCISIYRQEGEQ